MFYHLNLLSDLNLSSKGPNSSPRGVGAMHVTKPCKFTGFGAMYAHLKSKTLPGAPGSDFRAPDEGFGLEATPEPKIQRGAVNRAY